MDISYPSLFMYSTIKDANKSLGEGDVSLKGVSKINNVNGYLKIFQENPVFVIQPESVLDDISH